MASCRPKTLLICAAAATIHPGAAAFSPTPFRPVELKVDRKFSCSQQLRLDASTPLFSVSNTETDIETNDCELVSKGFVSSRRKWLKIITSTAGAATVAPQTSFSDVAVVDTYSYASGQPSSTTETKPSSLCDPTVTSWKKGSRVVHLLGTAHISSASANLSGRIVREVKPDAVFLELDLQRLGRAFRGGQPLPGVTVAYQDERGGLQVGTVSSQKQNRGLLYAIAKLIGSGNPIQSMYSRLEDQGFIPGEEFIVAVEEGLDVGSVIVLGDRSMDKTLRKLALAISVTDTKKLTEADKRMTDMMKEKLPLIDEWEKSRKGQLSPEELNTFVETMKTRETTRELMNILKQAAPELHDALVGERDIYMGQGINALSQFQTMVAVMGLGHLDGVGNILRSLGWSPYNPRNCLF